MFEETGRNGSNWRSRAKFAFIAFAVIGAFFLLAEHRAHVLPWLPWLPWLLLAACLLMHVFMHRSHGVHHHGGNGPSDRPPSDATRTRYNAPVGAGHTGSDSTSDHQHGERS